MAAELTIQSVEGLSQAFDKLNRSVSGVKSSLGTIKGTNALRELQSVVAGVNGLQAAISTMDRGLGAALGKIVSKLDELPRAIADTLGSGAVSVRTAGKKLGESAGQGVVDGVTQSTASVRAARRALQEQYEELANMGKVKLPVLQQFQTAGVQLFPQDKLRIKEAQETQRTLNAMLRANQSTDTELQAALGRMEQRTKQQVAQATEAYNASLSAGSQMVRAVTKTSKDEVAARKAAEAELQAALGQMEQRTKQQVAQATEAYNASLSAGSQMVKLVTRISKDEVAARKAAEAELQAALDQMEQRTKQQVAQATEAYNASLSAGSQMVKAITKASKDEVAARKAANATLEKTLRDEATFRATQEATAKADALAASRARITAAANYAKPQVLQTKASGDYSVFAPSSKDHGALKVFNTELSKTPVRAAAASKGLQNLGIDANTTHSAMRGLASGFNLLWLTWGNLAPLLTGAAISNGFMQTMKLGVEVTHTLTQLMVLGEESAGSVKMLEDQMIGLARTTPYGLAEIVKAMKTLELAGLSAAETMAVLPDVLNFAVAGDTSVEKAADVMTSVAKAFNYTANEYSIIGDVIAKAAAISKASVESMGEAFKVASVLNKQYGASLKDVGLGLALVNNLGIQGSAAGTALRNMYVDLSGRTKEVAKTMKALGISVLDENGKFYDFVTVIGKVKAGLDSLGDDTAKSAAKLKLFSERGSKPIIEALDQLEQKAKESGTTFASELERMRGELENAAGFQGLAAAKLSLTSANEIKSVFSTLQASAYEAFKAVEPLIFGVAEQLKSAFKSEEFRTALQNMIVLVAKATTFLVDHLGVIVKIGAAYAALKTANFAVGLFAGVSQGLAGLTNSALAMQVLGKQAAPVADKLTGVAATAVTTSTAVSTLAVRATAASGALTTLTAVGSRLFGFLAGPWGLAITAAASAWAFYAASSNKAAEANDRLGDEAKTRAYIDKLRDETKLLEDKAKALLLNVTLEEYQRSQESDKAKEAAGGREANALKAYSKAAKEALEIQSQLDAAGESSNKSGALRLAGKLQAAQAAMRAAKQEIEDAKAAKKAIEESEAAYLKKARTLEFVSDMMREMKADDAKANASYGDVSLDDKAAKASNLLSEIEKRYKDEFQAAKEAADREQRMLQDRKQNLLVTEGEYQAKSTQLAERSEQARLAVIDKYAPQIVSAYRNAYSAAQEAKDPGTATANLENQLKTALQQLSSDSASVSGEAFERVTKNANAAAGAIQKLQQEYSAYWEKDAARLAEQSAARQLAADLDMAGESAKTFSAAAATAMQAYTPQISKTASELAALKKEQEAVQIALGTTDFSLMGGTETSGQITDLTNRISFLTTELERLKAKAKETATSAGSLAVIEKYLGKDIGSEAAKGYDKASRALAGFINGVVNLTEAWKEQEAVRKEAEDKRARGMLDAKNPEELAKNEITYRKTIAAVNEKAAQQDIRNYGNIAGAAKTFFKEGSQGYKNLGNIEKAFRIAEFAMATKAVAMKVWEWATKTTVVATGEGTMTATTAAGEAARNLLKIPGVFLAFMSQLGPWGIPAAAAAIAAIGIAYGARKPSGQFEAPNEGKGTTFGDSDAKSKSITNAIEKLADNSDITLQYSSGMLSALKNIEANIGGITNLVLRGNVDSDAASRLGVSGGTKVAAINSAELNLTLAGAMLGGPLGAALGAVVSKIPIVQKITNALFGAKTTVKGSGLSLGDTSLATLAGGGGNLQEYADTNTTKKFLGITYSNKNSTITGAADPVLARQFGLVFKGFYDAIKLAAVPLGQNLDEVTTRLNNFVVKIGKIDLQGLTGEQIQEKLTAVLGAAADNIASGVLPGLEDYQKVGEGYFETVIRVANAVEVAKLALDGLGISMVDYTKVINKQGDVATEIIRDSVLAKEIATTARSTITVPNEPPRMKAAMVSAERFTSEWESYYDAIDNVNTAFEETFSTVEVVTTTLTGVGKIIQTFEGTAEELVQVYTALMGVRQSLADIGKAGTDFGIEMIKAAGGIEKLQDGLQSYYDNYLSDEERIAAMTGKLQKSFGDLGKEMPTSIEGFKALIEGQETVTVAGQETFAKLIILSDAFKALQDALANLDTEAKRIADERKSLEDQLKTAQEAYNQATMTSEQLLKLQRDALDASNVSLFDQIQATKAATEAANKATSERKSLQDQLNDLTLSETEKLALQRSALEEVNQALFDQVQAAKAAKAAETELAETRKKQTDEIKSLQDQYDDLTMTEAEKVAKAREALLTEDAKLIFDKIQAFKAEQAAKEAAEKAAEDAAAAAAKAQEDAARAAEEAANAAQKLKDAWLDVATSIMEEVKRIRGDLSTNPQQRLAQAQSAFSIAAAQAQAGDIEAAKSLPKLSQDLLKVAGDSAKTSLEFAQIQGSTLASLDRTLRYIASSQGVSVPAFAEGGTHTGGMRLVGERGAEMEVTGSSRIYSNQQLASMLNGGEEAAELREEVRQLREQMAALMELNNKYASVIATNSALMYKLLKKIAPDDAMITREATA